MISFVYITASGMEEARKIGRALVEERLAACVNILDNMNSMYWWEGKVQDEREAVVIAKTKRGLVQELISRVKALHSYAVPCIVSWPIQEGYRPFLEWIRQEAKAAPEEVIYGG
jgi:periplasmic divalent cation tolerance protein